MLISLKNTFIFVCVPKCASTSSCALLRGHCDIVLDGVTRFKHLPYMSFHKRLTKYFSAISQSDISAFEIIALMREPLDWLNSWYRFRARPELGAAAGDARKNYSGDNSFERFLEIHFSESPPSYARIKPQTHYFCLDGVVPPNLKLFRYEDYSVFEDYMSQLLGRTLKSKALNVSVVPKRDYDLQSLKDRWMHKLEFEYSIYNSITTSTTATIAIG